MLHINLILLPKILRGENWPLGGGGGGEVPRFPPLYETRIKFIIVVLVCLLLCSAG